MGLRLREYPGFALTEDTGNVLVVGFQAGFHDNKPLVNSIHTRSYIIHAAFQGSDPVGKPGFHFTDAVGQVGMAPSVGTYDSYNQRYQVYGLFVHLYSLLVQL